MIFFQENGQKVFNCTTCNYKCSKKYSWDRHLLTLKHEMTTFFSEKGQDTTQNVEYKCNYCNLICNKKYVYENHLLTKKHKKI